MSSEEITPVDRPARHPDNTPLVMGLYFVGSELRRIGDTITDLAKTIQNATERVDDLQRERIARELDETARAAAFGAGEVRTSKP